MPLRIAFPYPVYWPYVRRGAERCIHDLATEMARRGHQVDILTSKPGHPAIKHEEGVRIIYFSQLSHPLIFHFYPLIRLYAFGAAATRHLLQEQYDVAHLMSYSEIVLAPLLRHWRNLPYLFHLIVREHWWPGRFDRWAFRQLIRRADRVAALSPHWADHIAQEHGRQCSVLSPGVDMNTFRPRGQRDLRRPQVLFTADLGDPRKGGALLLRAWDEIHQHCPEAVLVLAGPFGMAGFHPEEVANSMLGQLSLVRNPAARAAIEIRGPGTVGELPIWYSQSAVTVLPSVDEAFGMVVTESLASGTPAVCSSDGGPGEIITNPDVGATVPLVSYLDLLDSRRAHELAEAVLYAIDLSRQPHTEQRCREWAAQWSLTTVGDQAEALYYELAESRRSAPSSLRAVEAMR